MDAHTEVYQYAHTCNAQQIARQTLVGDVLHVRYKWTKAGSTIQADVDASGRQHHLWSSFSRALNEQVFIFGYVVYRLETVHGADVHERTTGAKRRRRSRRVPCVENGHCIKPEWNPETHSVQLTSEGGEVYKLKNGWHIQMPYPPRRIGQTNDVLLDSPASRSLKHSKLRDQLWRTMRRRDQINTEIGVLTQQRRQFGGQGAGVAGEAWFTPGMHGAMSGSSGLINYQPTEAKIDNQFESMRQLDEMSKRYRELDRRVSDGPLELTEKQHTEHFVTATMDGREIAPRSAPNELQRILHTLFIEILLAHGVMPHVIGMNMNAERNAASPITTEAAMARYYQTVRDLQGMVQEAIFDMSDELSDHTASVSIVVCATEHTLRTIEGVLTPEAARAMYAQVYNRPLTEFALDNVKRHQDTLLGEKVIDGSRNRLEQTSEQKQSNLNAKSDVPV
jgi:hypothetical protein